METGTRFSGEFFIILACLLFIMTPFLTAILYSLYDMCYRTCPMCNQRGYRYNGTESEGDKECQNCGYKNYTD